MQEEKTVQKIKQVPCPNCKEPAEFTPNNKYRPFCSERCKLIDLGDWANENYKIPDKNPPKDFEEPN